MARYGPSSKKRVASAMRRRKHGTLRSGKSGKGGRVRSGSRQSPLACRKRAKRELRFRARNPAKPLRCAELGSGGLPIFGLGKSIL
jgi:hypothetical protein